MRIFRASLFVMTAAMLLIPFAGCGQSAKFETVNTVIAEDGNKEYITKEEVPPEHQDLFDRVLKQSDFDKDGRLSKMEWQRGLEDLPMSAPQTLMLGVIVLLIIIIPFVVGNWIATSLKVPDYGWKIGLIIFTTTVAAVIVYNGWPPKQGIDLKGGVIMVYEVNEVASAEQKEGQVQDPEAELSGWGKFWQGLFGYNAAEASSQAIDMPSLVAALTKRIDPGGVREIVVRPFGTNQIEIIIPDVEDEEINLIKRTISKSGFLEFMLVANPDDEKNSELIQTATDTVNDRGPRAVKDSEGRVIGRWVAIGTEDVESERAGLYRKIAFPGDIVRIRGENETDWAILDWARFNNELPEKGVALEVLMALNPRAERNVKGDHLGPCRSSRDQNGNPCVDFTMTAEGTTRMGALTGDHLPNKQTGNKWRLGIVMDGELLSAPSIQGHITNRGQITGDFTSKEVDFLVSILRAGRLPAVLREVPISENRISELLGADTIRSSKIAIGTSLILVLIFMVIYYRFSGIVACLAVLMNLLLILGAMIGINAAFTLPGLAGLVLTVGMAVDANVLIFERIREELNRGAALRMAIRNGFARATTTIVDANLTTLITAVVLYMIGTDQIRGFAVTLILGILMSMYTAIFCARVVFDIAERRKFLGHLRMSRIVGETNIDFISKERTAAFVSITLIFIGLVAVFVRGKTILDVDFNGGTTVEIMLEEDSDPQKQIKLGEIRKALKDPFDGYSPSVTEVILSQGNGNRVFKVDTSITGEEDVFLLEYPFGVKLSKGGGKPNIEEVFPGTPAAKADLKPQDVIVSVNNKETKTKAPLVETLRSLSAGDRLNLVILRDGKELIRELKLGDYPSGVVIVQSRLKEAFGPESGYTIVHHEMDFTADGKEPKKPEATVPTAPKEPDANKTSGPTTINLPSRSFMAMTGERTLIAQADPPEDTSKDDTPTEETTPPTEETTPPTEETTPPTEETTPPTEETTPPTEETTPPTEETTPPTEETTPPTEETTPPTEETTPPTEETTPPVEDPTPVTTPKAPLKMSVFNLTFGNKINEKTLRGMIEELYPEDAAPVLELLNPEWEFGSNASFEEWTLKIALPEDEARQKLATIQDKIAGEPVWPSSNKIGSAVAGKTKTQAIAALLVSLFGIVGYIWIRFQKVVFGLAAVVALVHDVLVTLGALAISAFVADYLGLLLIEEFKISLPVVAAFLTIIGYSLNDTIVVFDRIREVRGKDPNLTATMVNKSINQTLSRTLLTSLTTLLTVLILYCFGGQAIHAFAFCLVVGVMVGTYSSIFVASPVLLWIMGSSKKS